MIKSGGQDSTVTELILTDDQVRLIDEAQQPIVVRSPNGDVLGRVDREFTEQDVAEIEEVNRRTAKPHKSYTTKQALEFLESLDSK